LIQAVTLADVKRVSKRLFDPAHLTVVIGGSPAESGRAAPQVPRPPVRPAPVPPPPETPATVPGPVAGPQVPNVTPKPGDKPVTSPATTPQAAKKP
jgi:hypothetical protein